MADAVEVRPAGGGTRLRLRVKPGARRDRLLGAHGGALKLEVRSVPERGKANAAVSTLVADGLGVASSTVEILTGRTGRDKVVAVTSLSAAEVVRRLCELGIDAVVTD